MKLNLNLKVCTLTAIVALALLAWAPTATAQGGNGTPIACVPVAINEFCAYLDGENVCAGGNGIADCVGNDGLCQRNPEPGLDWCLVHFVEGPERFICLGRPVTATEWCF